MLFRSNLARFSGTHVYCDSNDVILADSSVVALHSLEPGPKRLLLPEPSTVWDVVTGKPVARRAREIRFTLDAPGTRVFRITAQDR